MMVQVINRHDTEYKARFDGRDYFFVPGKPQMISEEAAKHLFAWSLDDDAKYRVLIRWGRPKDYDWLNGFDCQLMDDSGNKVLEIVDLPPHRAPMYSRAFDQADASVTVKRGKSDKAFDKPKARA